MSCMAAGVRERLAYLVCTHELMFSLPGVSMLQATNTAYSLACLDSHAPEFARHLEVRAHRAARAQVDDAADASVACCKWICFVGELRDDEHTMYISRRGLRGTARGRGRGCCHLQPDDAKYHMCRALRDCPDPPFRLLSHRPILLHMTGGMKLFLRAGKLPQLPPAPGEAPRRGAH
eukprot:CAMPEP_0113247806 /NCGR_PEP_ID=MMETSP0008_2-20120614/10185_1 /TAXON_ID=97485 /ORGANISM="Prymnesium parvum" /LENGTH=176 /DNA_ID=CAMNT_0000095623 /DNA_START=136 /DNA_END=664 /DNA_ORIENTATION=- /assembly_acc=CAM_ASM_000153